MWKSRLPGPEENPGGNSYENAAGGKLPKKFPSRHPFKNFQNDDSAGSLPELPDATN
jgi:hypothetical protein